MSVHTEYPLKPEHSVSKTLESQGFHGNCAYIEGPGQTVTQDCRIKITRISPENKLLNV